MLEFPLYKQIDSMDFGPSCLQMVAKFYGKTFSIQTLRSRAFIAKSGVSMLGISDAAESIGFRTRGYRLTWEQLRDEVPLPLRIANGITIISLRVIFSRDLRIGEKMMM